MHLLLKATVIGFTFSSHWSLKMSESLSEFYQFIQLAENGSYPLLVSDSVVALVLVFLQSFEIRSIPCHQWSHYFKWTSVPTLTTLLQVWWITFITASKDTTLMCWRRFWRIQTTESYYDWNSLIFILRTFTHI